MSAGAYGFTMSSNYNPRPRVAEVMVSTTNHQLIRKRETVQDLFAGECLYEILRLRFIQLEGLRN
jgi:diaminopimelate decarboxylase